jgi:hypothetical protein
MGTQITGGGDMPDLMGTLFGTPDTLKTVSNLDENQKQLYNALLPILMQNMGNLPGYSGQLTAGLTGTQRGALGNAMTAAGGVGTMDQGAYDASRAALLKALNVDPNQINANFNASVVNPTVKALQEQVLPQLNEQFAGQGNFWSSARMNQQGKIVSDTMGELGAQKAAYEDNAINRALGAVPQAMSMAAMPTELANARLNAMNTLYGLGTQEQQTNQARLTNDYQEWLRTQVQNNPMLAQVFSYLGVPSTLTYTQQGSPGIIGQLVGIAGALSGIPGIGNFFGGNRIAPNFPS